MTSKKFKERNSVKININIQLKNRKNHQSISKITLYIHTLSEFHEVHFEAMFLVFFFFFFNFNLARHHYSRDPALETGLQPMVSFQQRPPPLIE